jgi:lysophospholipase L1-like esterase
MPIQLQNNQTLLFIGDSITDCDHRDAPYAPLGRGYVRLFSDLLTIREPTKTIAILNRGIGGNNVEDLRSRWSDDVFSYRPDWLSIKIGINDLNSNLCGKDPLWLNPDMYEKTYREILTLTRKELPDCQILLISPFFLSRDQQKESYRGKVNRYIPEYIAAVHGLHREFGTRYLGLQEVFDQHLKHRHPDVFAPEPVHPNQTGHLLIAEAVYSALS